VATSTRNPPGQRLRARARTLRRDLGAVELAAIFVLLLAAWSTYAPTAAAVLAGQSAHVSVWTERPLLGANVFEIAFLVAAVLWAFRALDGRERWSFLDSHVVALGALLLGLTLIAAQRGSIWLTYLAVDTERVALLVAGYVLVTRMRIGTRSWRFLVVGLAAVLLLRFAVLTVQHGVVNSTEFATVTGRVALIITEDVFLVGVALVALWGLAVDRVLSARLTAVVVVAILGVLLVDFLSYRRGALLFIGLLIVVRTLRASKRHVALAFAVVAAGVGLGAAFAEAGLLTREARPETATLRPSAERGNDTDAPLPAGDTSTEQRTAELRNWQRNTRDAVDAAVGRGLGAAWNAEVTGPVDVASYGGGETEYVRLGWHIFGLDWVYKVGFLGALGVAGLLVHGALMLTPAVRATRDRVNRSLASSMALAFPLLLLQLFTNARLAVFAGVTLGLASKAADLARSGSELGEPARSGA
jgi:hypothetical protein